MASLHSVPQTLLLQCSLVGFGALALFRYALNKSSVCNKFRLAGTIAIVTGGSRGVGRGVCLELGSAGATVFVVGRSRRGGPSNLPGQRVKNVPLGGTIDDTADDVTKLGGVGIPVGCDVANDAEMRSVIDLVRKKHGRLDILVNSAILVREDLRQKPPFWLQELELYDAYHVVGTRSTYIMSTLAVPLMLQSPAGSSPLIVNISSPGSKQYLFNIPYGVGKAGLDRIGKDMHIELRNEKTNIHVVTVHPGIVQTERMIFHRQSFKNMFSLDVTGGETVNFTGRAVCALAANPTVAKKLSGTVQTCTQLAKKLHFTDVDGAVPGILRCILPVLKETISKKLLWFRKKEVSSENSTGDVSGFWGASDEATGTEKGRLKN